MKCVCCYLEQWLGERGYQVYNLTETAHYAPARHGARMLREKGYEPDDILAFEEAKIPLSQVDIQTGGGLQFAAISGCKTSGEEVPADIDYEHVVKMAHQAMDETGTPVPMLGKQYYGMARRARPTINRSRWA